MINGCNVKPKKWKNTQVVFDDGVFSLIYGNYDGNQKKCLGCRWDGDINNPNDIGYPRQGKYPTWFVLPDALWKCILTSIQSNSADINQQVIKTIIKNI